MLGPNFSTRIGAGRSRHPLNVINPAAKFKRYPRFDL